MKKVLATLLKRRLALVEPINLFRSHPKVPGLERGRCDDAMIRVKKFFLILLQIPYQAPDLNGWNKLNVRPVR